MTKVANSLLLCYIHTSLHISVHSPGGLECIQATVIHYTVGAYEEGFITCTDSTV